MEPVAGGVGWMKITAPNPPFFLHFQLELGWQGAGCS